MNNDKIAQLEKLLSENKITEASALIKEIMDQKMTSEERGENLVNFATMYLDIMNSIDSEYEEALKEAVSALKDLDVKDLKKRDEDKLKKIRESLQ